MAFSTGTDRTFGHGRAIDILLYVSQNPGCKKSDVYRDVTRNQSAPKVMVLLEEAELLTLDDSGNATILELTEKGREVANLFLEMEVLLDHQDA